MKKHGYLLFIVLSITSLNAFMEAQELPRVKVSEFMLKAKTNDLLYINDTVVYMMTKSPLEAFPGYKNLYDSYDDVSIGDLHQHVHYGSQVNGNFNIPYQTIWCIRDGTLYLSDIVFDALPFCNYKSTFPDNEQYKLIEKLTGVKFDKIHPPLSNNPFHHRNTIGMMPAIWSNDTVLIKISSFQSIEGAGRVKSRYCPDLNDTIRIKRHGTPMKLDEWKKTPCEELIFKNGKLISKKITDIY